MEKIEFNNSSILEQVNYINSKLSEGESLRSISSNLEMSKTTIRDRFIKVGCVFNPELRQYYKDKTIEIKPKRSIAKVLKKAIISDLKPIEEGNIIELLKYKDDLIELLNYKNDILEMINNYKSNIKVTELHQLDLNSLPKKLQDNIINKSIKIYDPVSKLFDEICSQYPSYKKQDIVSLALYEFYDKYK